MKQGVPKMVAWPISGNSLLHEKFLHRLLLSSWRDKTNSNYNSVCKWASWYKQRNRNPIAEPVEDLVNFLAELLKLKDTNIDHLMHTIQLYYQFMRGWMDKVWDSTL